MELASQELIETACAQTKLAAFGDESFREGLGVLTRALESEAELSRTGRRAARARLLGLLKNRLRIEDWRTRHRDIEAQEIDAPIFVVGLPRTGTTALAALLARDPATRSLRSWESLHPIPPPEASTSDDDPRIVATQAGLDAMSAAHPEWQTMYDGSATASTECQDLLGMEFRTWHFCGEYLVPSYDAWLSACDMRPAYECHRRALELLQWRCPPRRWLLHAPIHTLALDALDSVYPNARFILIHRDPARSLGSACSLISFMRSLWSERRDPRALGQEQLELWTRALKQALRFRDRAGESRFADVAFGDLVADPVATVEALYARLGLPFTGEAGALISAWAAAHPRGSHGEHRYRLEDFGLERSVVRERFAFYTECFTASFGHDLAGPDD